MTKILGLVLLALVVAGFVALASCDPEPAEPTGVELDVDIDRARTRAPLKTQKPAPAPKSPARKAGKR